MGGVGQDLSCDPDLPLPDTNNLDFRQIQNTHFTAIWGKSALPPDTIRVNFNEDSQYHDLIVSFMVTRKRCACKGVLSVFAQHVLSYLGSLLVGRPSEEACSPLLYI